jgi:hypothetical protein
MESIDDRRLFWAEHVRQWQASGLSQRAYCRQHDLIPRKLTYWVSRSRQQAVVSGGIVPARIADPAVTGDLVLRHTDGWQLVLPADIGSAWVSNLLRELTRC